MDFSYVRIIWWKQPIFIAIVSALVSGSVAAVFLFKPTLRSNPQVLSGQSIPPSPPPVEDQTDLTTLTFLLLGYGGPGHEGGFLTDAIVVARLDFASSKLTLVTVPRDLWVAFPDGVSRKINAAFAYGGKLPEITKEDLEASEADSASSTVKSMITNITGLPINYFIAVDFVGLQRAVGQVLDGVEVEVSEPLFDPWYPIEGEQLNTCGLTAEEVGEVTAKYSGFDLQKQFPCRYEELNFPSGRVRMEGGDVLKFVRSRHSGSDFVRSRRQIEVLLGIRDRLTQLSALDDAPEFFSSLLYTIQTDLDADIVKFIAPTIRSFKDYKVNSINLDTSNVLEEARSSGGAFILLPKAGEGNWSQIHELVSSGI